MHRIEINVQTGKRRTVELSAAEIAELEALPQPAAPVELTAAEKLAAAGLTVDELKGLLGI